MQQTRMKSGSNSTVHTNELPHHGVTFIFPSFFTVLGYAASPPDTSRAWV
jgi:hypothetical protein